MEGNNTGMAANNTGNCTYGGTDEDHRFGEPMLWVGLYVAAASLVCAAAFVMDLIRSLRWRKMWVPPKFLVLNAAVLTILGVAVKIPNDINGTMPGLLDQLAKPTGMLLICTVMTHAMPSLAVMDKWELLSNMIALGILVISTAVNILFQTHTGLITRYASLNKICTVQMLFLFSILVSHSLSVATVKEHLEREYQSGHSQILGDVRDKVLSGEELKEYVKKYWLMALSSSPDFVLLSSGMFVAGQLLYICPFWYLVVSLLSSFSSGRGKGCYVRSDYRWTTGLIFSAQILPVVLGYASVLVRVMQCGWRIRTRKLFSAGKYRIRQLGKWKKDPLPFLFRSKRVRSAAYRARALVVDLLILIETIMVLLTWLVLACSVLCGLIIWTPVHIFLFREIPHFRSLFEADDFLDGMIELGEWGTTMSDYVLLSEGDATWSRGDTAKQWADYPDKWFAMGRERSPPGLDELVGKSPWRSYPSDDSRSTELRAASIRRLTLGDLGDCWSLHLATLMCVIYAVFGRTTGADLEALERALDEGFLYFTMVDANNGRCGKNGLKAAKMVWENLRFRRQWLDKPLLDVQSDFCGAIEDLKAEAEEHVSSKHKRYKDLPEQLLSLEAVAAKSMSGITGALLGYNRPFTLQEMEAEVAGAVSRCLAELPTAILKECSNGSYGHREKHVRLAAQVLGETEEILKILEARRLSTSISFFDDL